MVILRRISDRDTVKKKGMEICYAIASFKMANGHHGGCSAGAVLCAPGEKPTAALIERTDKALYQAKQQGKGSCTVWSEEEVLRFS